jgi:hypothetical protein
MKTNALDTSGSYCDRPCNWLDCIQSSVCSGQRAGRNRGKAAAFCVVIRAMSRQTRVGTSSQYIVLMWGGAVSAQPLRYGQRTAGAITTPQRTHQIKQGMKQELLTGITRLVQALNKETQYG